jgi:hypothetical protein
MVHTKMSAPYDSISQKKFEHPPKPVVYYSMNNLRGRLGSTRKTKRGRGCDAASSSFDPANASAMQAHFRPELTGSAPKTFGECGRYLAAVIEGGQRSCNSEAYATPSDLSRSSTSKRFDARLHGAGINDEEKAGQRSNTDERHIGRQRFGLSLRTVGATSWSGGKPSHRAAAWRGRWRNHGNPCAEEGMHTRSQQIFLAGAGWAIRTDAHARNVAVTQRLRSESFGGGETRHANAETSLTFGEISEVRQPASYSL